jgi:hypothetical protein
LSNALLGLGAFFTGKRLACISLETCECLIDHPSLQMRISYPMPNAQGQGKPAKEKAPLV